MKKILILLALTSLFSCTKYSERDLYNENDPEWDDILALAQEECVTDSDFFSRYDTYKEFDNAPFNTGDIFKITQDDNDAQVIYVKVTAVNASDVTLVFNGEEDDYDMTLTYSETNHEDLGTFLKAAACNPNYQDYFDGVSGLGGNILYYSWEKESIYEEDDDILDRYKIRDDDFVVNLDYPSIFYLFNGTRTLKYDNTSDDANNQLTKVSKITITDGSDDDDCKNETNACNFNSTGTFPNCTVTVDDDAYDLRPFDSSAIILGGDASCEFLESAD